MDDQLKPIRLGVSEPTHPLRLWVLPVVLIVLVIAAAGVLGGTIVWALADEKDPKNLMEQVTKGSRTGIVADNVGEEVCMFLIKEDGTAETPKSCIPREQALNLGQPHEELSAVELQQGSGLYRITRDTRFGVSDGVIFEPIAALPLIPTPTAVPTEQPEGK